MIYRCCIEEDSFEGRTWALYRSSYDDIDTNRLHETTYWLEPSKQDLELPEIGL